MNLQQIFDNTDFVPASWNKRRVTGCRIFENAVLKRQGLQQDWKDSVSQWAKSKMLIYMQTGKN